jgi:hypothetical protein
VLALVMLAAESNRGSNRPLYQHTQLRVSARSGNLCACRTIARRCAAIGLPR